MAYILDTADLPARDRVEAVRSAMARASAPCQVIHENPDDDVHARLGVWDLGSTNVFTTHATGIRLLRTGKQAKQDAMPVVALSVQQRARGRHEQFGRRRVVAPGELMAVDLSAPYDFSWSGPGGAGCLQVPVDHLGLPVDVVRRAIADLPRSPLHRLVTDHIAHLVANADRLAADPAAPALGAANVELARALLLSAGQPDRHGRAALAETLLTRVRTYVRRHLTDPDLSPAAIAGAHHISVRHLYQLCARAGFSLEQWIIEERLAGAHDELARATDAHRTVALTARRWGFADPAHFTRRFRARYGLTPAEWRRAARTDS
ncbi:helix-turn-helix domain-containing protein [Actinosynnema sp. NPDC047251]|uniref:Transcriptional regulator, AraC family n=1 Tax=Saccharothrix espanaensis (strain ATCC 51144 / DSM 44229 / JCM 9112 / NBRC 15066 / NRRL 15764) TaxID=1179773 RepID=K0K3F7_SACES|nr:helix-turn-helix domain-containing protein [Saccharothrix espanaensis]CCH32856.1 Transcriptional regulator, AraC family [Saccharothrix espanaensis DSM 44229]